MGKGIIKGGGTAGEYSIEVVLDTSRIQAEITRLTGRIAQVQFMMIGMEDGKRKSYYRLLLTSLEKKISYLENHRPENPILSAWCADLTEDLSGDVGTIEVPGERGTVLIRPGHNGGAAYSPGRDGILVPASSVSPAAAFYNLAMKPGWQKWMPTFRFGTITDLEGDICSVSLESASNSETGLGINQTENLSGVLISYMTCNGSAFAVGDNVVVEFRGSWTNPRVIGFKTNPKPCCIVYETYDNEDFDNSYLLFQFRVSDDYTWESWFADEALHVKSKNAHGFVMIGNVGTRIPVADYPVIRWSVDAQAVAGGSEDWNGGFIHFIVEWWPPGAEHSKQHHWKIFDNYSYGGSGTDPMQNLRYHSDEYTSWEMSSVGVHEVDLSEVVEEGSEITTIRVGLYMSVEAIVDFITLCPK